MLVYLLCWCYPPHSSLGSMCGLEKRLMPLKGDREKSKAREKWKSLCSPSLWAEDRIFILLFRTAETAALFCLAGLAVAAAGQSAMDAASRLGRVAVGAGDGAAAGIRVQRTHRAADMGAVGQQTAA